MSSTNSSTGSIVWLRQDLRLADNAAISEACKNGPVIFVYILESPPKEKEEGGEEAEEKGLKAGKASQWWLHHSLTALNIQLQKFENKLILRSGNPLSILLDLVKKTGAKSIFWNRRYEPSLENHDKQIKLELEKVNIEVNVFSSHLLFEPESIKTRMGGPYQVFTPYYNTCIASTGFNLPLPAPKKISAPLNFPISEDLNDWKLLPKLNWADNFKTLWKPGSIGGKQLLKIQLAKALPRYSDNRNNPNVDGTSRIAPYLHFGEIGIRELWHEIENAKRNSSLSSSEIQSLNGYQRQLIWREFSYHLMVHFPHSINLPLKEKFNNFPWHTNPRLLKAWQKGQTGYPYIDAGMRQLWATGWMHNRVRMAVASFLVKDLLLPWQQGAAWFWDTLVDADLANNTMGWQWVAGCGADASPYFRIFHPVTQGEKFDPEGDYVRQWVPELSRLEKKWIQKPWEAPESALAQAGIVLGKTYPKPIVDHAFARTRALAAYHDLF